MTIFGFFMAVLFFGSIICIAGTIIWALWNLRFIFTDINKINKRRHELGLNKPNEL